MIDRLRRSSVLCAHGMSALQSGNSPRWHPVCCYSTETGESPRRGRPSFSPEKLTKRRRILSLFSGLPADDQPAGGCGGDLLLGRMLCPSPLPA